MNARQLREQLEQLNDEATVTVSIHGSLFEPSGVGIECHDARLNPRIVLTLGQPYTYGRQVGA